MGETPRPTIVVEDLTGGKRFYPDANPNGLYDCNRRFCFRLGPYEGYWQWPWPEWIGLPDRNTLLEWFDVLDYWREFVMHPKDKDKVETCINKLLPHL